VLAVIRLDFDPAFGLLGQSVRLETAALAAAVLLTLVLAALAAGRLESRLRSRAQEGPRLRRDDLILIAFGAVPGAVAGGRLGYGLIHLDYYLANPSALLDPGQGGLELTLAVVGGTLTALAVVRLLVAPIQLWLQVVSLPLLVGLGLGKLAMALGGAGQGQFSEASWATVYARPGPWISPNAMLPALPSQLLEGGLVLLAAVLLAGALLLRGDRGPAALKGGNRFLAALGLWGAVRFGAAFTWRDGQVLGPLRAEQLLLLALIGGCVTLPRWPSAVRAGRARWAARRARTAAGP
jgi:prolipoprotein diacylglyceryltransferase